MNVLSRYGTLLGLVVIVAAFAAMSPRSFAQASNLINITQQMSLLTIVALGATYVMALSEFYKGTDAKGWLAKAPQSLSAGDALLRLQQIDGVWERPSESLTRNLVANLGSEEPMARAAAAAALGRVGAKEATMGLRRLLGDPSKLVQIAAAQALRRIASRFVVPPSEPLARE